MSELKWNWVYYPYLDAPNEQEESALKAGYIKVVDKSEADKVIAEKDKELRHHKYKRCLNKAEIASHNWHLHNSFYLMGHKDFELKKCERYERHRHRWLELAEKFKEAK